MKVISTREAAKKLGIHFTTLAEYIAVGKIPAPPIIKVRGMTIHMWTEAEIEHVRQLLPKIANGRKTRYSKLREKQKAPAKSPVPGKTKKKKSTKPPKAKG
jgi:predicted DNA-binding transcriptional regulator AlpA